jgi:hypothetical protein
MPDTQIAGLPPGAIVKPLASGLPPGAIVKPLATPSTDSTVSQPQPSFFDKVGVDVAKGMGLDTDALLAAHKTNGVTGQLLELGSQLAKGAGNFALSVAHDPFNIVKPLDAMASGVTKAAGLPDSSSQSLTDPNSYDAPNPAQLVGALSNVAAGVEAPEVADATAPLRNAVATKVVSPLVAKPAAATAADLAAGRSPAAAIVNEGLVGSKKMMLKQADATLGDLSSQADAALKASPNANSTLDIAPIIQGAIDAGQAAAKKSGNSAIVTRLDNLKTALENEFGSLQGTPIQVQRLKQQIGEVAQNLGAFKAVDPLEASAAGVMRDVYSRIDSLLDEQAPAVKDLNQRMADLISAKTGLLRNVAKESQSILDSHSLTSVVLKALKSTAASAPVLSGVAKLIGSTKD